MTSSTDRFHPPDRWPPEVEQIESDVLQALRDGAFAKYPGSKSAPSKFTGSWVATVEGLLANLCQRQACLTCSSGTAALELALRGLGVKAGDEVILSAYDYPGNYRTVEALGAIPRTVDVQPDRWIINADLVPQAITARTKAVVVSHLHGLAAPVESMVALCQSYKLPLIEDACQAYGGSLHHQPIGSWGDVSILSFGGSKLVTAGNGGAVLTNDTRLMQRMRVFNERPAPAYALSEIQAALLNAQLNNLPLRHVQRKQAAMNLTDAFKHPDWQYPARLTCDEDVGLYKLGWMVPQEKRDEILEHTHQLELPLGAGFAIFKRFAATQIPYAIAISKQLVVLDHIALHPNSNALELLHHLAHQKGVRHLFG